MQILQVSGLCSIRNILLIIIVNKTTKHNVVNSEQQKCYYLFTLTFQNLINSSLLFPKLQESPP